MLNWKKYKLIKEEREKEDVLNTLISFYNNYKRKNDKDRLRAIKQIYDQFTMNKISPDRTISQLLSIAKNGVPESLEDYHRKMDPITQYERPKWNPQNPISTIRKPRFAGINKEQLLRYYKPTDSGGFALKTK